MIVANFDERRVQPHKRVRTLEFALTEALDLGVQLLAQPTDLASGYTVQAERLNQVVDAARTHSLDVRLAHHGHQGALRPLARLQQTRKVAAVAHPWHLEIERANPRVPCPVAIAVSLPIPFAAALVALGAKVLGDLHF